MLTLMNECQFWTISDDIKIKPNDFSQFRYSTKKVLNSNNILAQGKLEYAEKRDLSLILNNRKPKRLKQNLKNLEELLSVHKVIYSEWKNASMVQLLLSNGLLVHKCINVYTGNLSKMAFDKYFIGKLASDEIAHALFTKQHIVLSYCINQLTVVYLQKPNMRRTGPEKISNMDPKIFHVLISGPIERNLARHLAVNNSFDLLIVWTTSSQNEVFPWRPTVRDQDRANMHVYKLRTTKLESLAYCWTENDPICVEFLRAHEDQVLTVEQKVSRKGDITAEICSYEIRQNKMLRVSVVSIPIGTQICCHSFSPDQEKLALGTIDRNLCIHDIQRKVTKFAPKTDIIPTLCTWHPDNGILIVANDRSQFQCFDLSLSFVANQPISEDVTPSNLHDLSHYFAIQPTLLRIVFSNKPDISNFADNYAQTDSFLLLVFENGPLGCIRYFCSTGMCGDFHNSGLTPDVLISKYLAINQLEKAVNLLLSLNWNTYGAICLISLHKICNYVFTRNEVKRTRNELLKRALESFSNGLTDETENEFGEQLTDMKRRFFVFLLRHNLHADAIESARNVGDYDLFMDLFNVIKRDPKLINFAKEAYQQAEIIVNGTDIMCTGDGYAGDTNSTSSCSHSSCSDCISKQTNGDKNMCERYLNKHQSGFPLNNELIFKKQCGEKYKFNGDSKIKSYVPPLPYFRSPILNAENIKINIPKPELRLDLQGDGTRINARRRPSFTETKPRINSSRQIEVPGYLSRLKNDSLVDPAFIQNYTGCSNKRTETLSSLSNKISLQSSWSRIPDQTLGIPVAPIHAKASSNLSSSLTLLPRSSRNYLLNNQQHSHDNLTYNSTAKNFENSFNLPKFYQHPLVSGTIPPSVLVTSNDDDPQRIKKPTSSILSNGSSNANNAASGNIPNVSNNNILGKRDSGEKNKVKFSDTVQVAVVPEIPRKEKAITPKRNGYHLRRTDPQKELADSLPLCHPNDDYLKDFNPVTDSHNIAVEKLLQPNQKNPGTIKVVHFGVV